MPCVLTYDLGTTYFKAALFDERLALVTLARVATPRESPQPGWSQIDASRFANVIVELTEQLRQQSPQRWGDIVAVSFATQANSVVLLDRDSQPLTPIVLWSDRRAESFVDAVRDRIVTDDFYERTGIPQYGDGFSPGKLLWFQAHEPVVFNDVKKVCYLSDYLTLLLTGRRVTEAGVAGLSGLLDIHALRWRHEAIEAIGCGDLAFPRPVRAGGVLGEMRGEFASRLQLPASAQFVVGCLDQYAGAIGTGNLAPGAVSETTGTVLATVSLADRFDPSLQQRGVFQGPAFRDGLYWRMCFSDVSANLLEAFRNTHAANMSYEQLSDLAGKAPAGCDGLRLDAAKSVRQRQPVFVGDVERYPLGHRVRAIFEAVATELCEQVAMVVGDARPAQVFAAGGGARSAVWLAIKSERLGVPVRAAASEEPTSRGAAAIALAAVTGSTLASAMNQ